MQKVEKLEKSKILHKSFLIYLKFIPHCLAFVYIIYTILGILGIDMNLIGCIFHMSLFGLLHLWIISLLFQFCYVHRLPIYYIGTNELITSIDYYFNIPINIFNICILHILLIAVLLYGYSYYYASIRIPTKVKKGNL